MKKIFSTCLLAVIALLTLQACDVSVSYDYGYSRSYRCRYYGDCGYYGRGWYRGHRRHHGNHGPHRFMEESNSVVVNAATDSAKLLAADYGIRLSSAQEILALAGNSAARSEAAQSLNLSRSDLVAIANLQMPSKETVLKVAGALNERPKKIQRLLADFIVDARAAR